MATAKAVYESSSSEPYVPPPGLFLSLTEAHRALAEIVSLRLSRSALRKAPKGDGHPVMVLPGFLGSDGYNAAMRRFLRPTDRALRVLRRMDMQLEPGGLRLGYIERGRAPYRAVLASLRRGETELRPTAATICVGSSI